MFSPSSLLVSSRRASSFSTGRSFVCASVALASVISLSAAPDAAHAQKPRSAADLAARAEADNKPLSDKVKKQIAGIMALKASLTPTQRKMDSHLLAAAKMERGLPVAPGIQRIRTNMLDRDMAGRILVDIKVQNETMIGADLLSALKGATAQIVNVAGGTIRARVPVLQIESIAGFDSVLRIEPAEKPRTNLVTSQGDAAHGAGGAQGARATYGVNGAGIKVGVLSDSYVPAASRVGELPAVTVLTGQEGEGANEGNAMLEIVHDIAPGAQLYYASAFNGAEQFAQNIRNLAASGCSIIVDDVFYLSESPFQDDIIAQAVNDVTAQGVLYFSSAGNQGSVKAGTASCWEGDFVQGDAYEYTETESGKQGHGFFHSFGDGSNYVDNDGNVFLFWADPIQSSANDYDLFAINFITDEVDDFSINVQDGTGAAHPMEAVASLSFWDSLYIFKPDSAAPKFMHLDGFGNPMRYATTGQTKGHSAAVNAYSVAAAPAANGNGSGAPIGPWPGQYTSEQLVENFSSDGPRKMFFNANGTPVAGGSVIRQKPDITAADGVSTSVVGFQPFFGTSAAAPHAAAIAALLKQYRPSLTPAQIRTALTTTAIDIEGIGFDVNSGAGIVMPKAALASVSAATANVSAVTLTPATVTGGAQNSVATVTLTGAAPTGGLTVSLASSNTNAATVPASVVFPAGATTRTVTITSKSVATAQNVVITASAAGRGSASATLAVTSSAAAWSGADFAVSKADSTSRLVWKKTDGTYAFWSVNAAGTVTGGKTYGPVAGYVVVETAVGPNGKTVVLLKDDTNKRVALWILAANSAAIEASFVKAYPAGYVPGHIAVDQANKIRMSWEAVGTATKLAMWTMEPTSAGTISNSYVYASSTPGLKNVALAVGGDNKVRLLWNNTANKQAIVWTLPTPYAAPTAGYTYGPITNATISDIAVGSDNKPYLLWKYTNNAVALWRTNGATIEAGKVYGPIANVTPLGLGEGADNLARLYWSYADGRTALWKISADTQSITGSNVFGPVK